MGEDDWGSYFDESAQLEGLAYPTFSGLPLYARDPYADEGGFGDVGQIPGGTAAPGSGGGTEAADQAYRTSPGSASYTGLDKFLSNLKSLGGKAGDYLSTPQGLMSLLALLGGAGLGYSERRKPSGGGGTQAFKMPTAPQTRTIEQGKYGPIARYAAHGGLMHAYANGGHVRMEDGGFVMTKRAVDGAGGPQGIAQLVPGARPIQGPGTGTSDSIPASIHGPNGVTPAKVSNGEAYLPRAAVQQAGGPERMYALMNSLQRRA